MRPTIEFDPFPKIARLSREIVITEKLDGSSGTIFIDNSGGIFAASRNRWITPEDDNYGFARWVEGHKQELIKLGPGWHRGEWWGAGIQRRYGLTEKRFSLFNVDRWGFGGKEILPVCCSVVPELWRGDFDTGAIEDVLFNLKEYGSQAAPGFMDPEGIVIWHTAARVMFKKTIRNDESPKTFASSGCVSPTLAQLSHPDAVAAAQECFDRRTQ